MKKIFYSIMMLSLVFVTGCDPMEDIYEELDAEDTVIVGEAEYTLTDDDYEELDLSYGSFNSIDEAKELLPDFLADLYPYWGKSSSVTVGYDLYLGSEEGVSTYTDADQYYLSNTDYPAYTDNAVGFYEDEDPADYLPGILAAQIDSPTDGQVVLARYKQYVGETVYGVSNYFEANFNGSLDDFEAISVTGDQTWYDSSYGDDEFAKISGYSGGSNENEDWLISPEIDFTGQTNLLFQMTQAINYVDYAFADGVVGVYISTDYTTGGDHTTATWDSIDLTTVPGEGSWTFIQSEDYDLAAYEGETVHIAFKYTSTASNSSTWEIDQVLVQTPGVEGTTVSKEVFYVYDGSEWEVADDAYFIQDSDFDSMGDSYGQPGYYNNFSSSISPDDYLVTFLGTKYPYAQDDTELYLIYDYYSSSSGSQIRGNLYTVVEGAWTAYESTISTTLQFGHDGTSWVPDNTITYTLDTDDYDYIVSAYSDTYASETANMATYGNFNGYSWTEDMIYDVIGGVLLNNFPSAEEGQKYAVTYSYYYGSTTDETITLILEDGAYVAY